MTFDIKNYQKHFTIRINCSSNLKIFTNSSPSTLKFFSIAKPILSKNRYKSEQFSKQNIISLI